jgi:hypothetical protein
MTIVERGKDGLFFHTRFDEPGLAAEIVVEVEEGSKHPRLDGS